MKWLLASSALNLVALACGPSHEPTGGPPLEGKWGFVVRSATAQRLSEKTIAVLLSESAASTCLSDPSFFEPYRSAAVRFTEGAPGGPMPGSLLYFRNFAEGYTQVTEIAETVGGAVVGFASDSGVSGRIDVVLGRLESPGPIEGPFSGSFEAAWCPLSR